MFQATLLTLTLTGSSSSSVRLMIFSGLSSASNDNARLVVEVFLGSLSLLVVCCCKLDLLVDGREGKFDLSSKLGELG